VLGGLTVDEQRAVEAHLVTCEPCRAELAELEPIPSCSTWPGPSARSGRTHPPPRRPHRPRPTAPPTAGPAPTATDDGHARSNVAPIRRRRPVLIGAAAALAVAAALVIGVLIARPSDPSFSQPISLQAVGGVPASGTAALRPTGSGTVVRLDLEGLPTGGDVYFECVWSSNRGTHTAGTFRSTPDGSAQVDLVTAALRYPGWTLEIVEHTDGGSSSNTVLQASA
jgi:hypothetical protein